MIYLILARRDVIFDKFSGMNDIGLLHKHVVNHAKAGKYVGSFGEFYLSGYWNCSEKARKEDKREKRRKAKNNSFALNSSSVS